MERGRGRILSTSDGGQGIVKKVYLDMSISMPGRRREREAREGKEVLPSL